MLKPARPVPLLLAALAFASLTSCKRTAEKAASIVAPQLALTPAATARADLVAEVVLPSPERTLTNVGAMAKKLALPFGEAELRKMLLARGELPSGVIERLDLGKPVTAVVVIAPTKTGGDASPTGARGTEVVLTFALKDSSKLGFDGFVAAMGKVVESSKDAVRVQAAEAGTAKPVWLLPRDGSVLVAEKIEALVAGGAMALEARRAVAQDVRVTLLPEGMARASGTTLAEWVEKAKLEVAKQQADVAAAASDKEPKPDPAAMKVAQSMVGSMLDGIKDTSEGRINLALDAEKGLSSAFDLVPRPGSPFAKLVGTRLPYTLDPALLTGQPPAAVWGMGDISLTRKMFMAVRDPLLAMAAPEAERPKIAATIDSIFDSLSGPISGSFSFEGGPKLAFAYDVIYGLKPGTDGKKLLADIESMIKAPWLSRLFETAFSGMMKVKLSSKREGDALAMQVALDTKKAPPSVRAQLKGLPFLDGKPIEGRTAIVGDKLIVTTGLGSKARLQVLRTASAAAPTGDLAAALAETKGDDGVYYADLAALFRPLVALAASGGLPPGDGGGPNPAAMAGMAGAMLKDARFATWASYRGGDTLTVGWRIPMSTFQSVAGIARQMMGMGGGGQ